MAERLLRRALGGVINTAWSNAFKSDGIVTGASAAVHACD